MIVQLQLLNKILDSSDSTLISLNNLTEEFFSDYPQEFHFIKDHIDKYGNCPDKETFLSKFPNFDVIQVNETTDYLIDELFDDRNKRNLAKVFNKVRDLLNKDKVDEAMQVYASATDTILKAKHLESVDIIHNTSRYERYVEKISNFNTFYVKTGFPELDKIIGGWDRKEELATIIARTNQGKCLEKGTRVLMADGTLKAVEEIVVGDRVQSVHGVNTVLGVHSGISNGWKIVPSKYGGGKPFVVSADHILTLAVYNFKKRCYEHDLVDIKVEDYLNLSAKEKGKLKLYRPEVEYEECLLKIPPYILGSWLGDGTSCRVEITNADEEVINEWRAYASNKGLVASKRESISYEITFGKRVGPRQNPVTQDFKYYNLLGNKHIPNEYFHSSIAQRKELLAGLIDTDGYKISNTMYEISQKSRCLADDIQRLCYSVGLSATVYPYMSKYKGKECGINYSIHIKGDVSTIPVRLTRKRVVDKDKYHSPDSHYSSFSIEPVERIEYYGFMCDGDHRFLLDDCTVTHNTWMLLKTALAAAEQGLNVGIYSGEMSEDKVGYRIDTLYSHISNGALTHGSDKVLNDYKRYIDSLSSSIKGHIRVFTPEKNDGLAGVTALRGFIEKEGLDMLCIDQHSLLSDDRHARNPVERAANISRDLKTLQVLKKIPIITVSQMNREKTDDGKLDTTQIAQSDRIGQDSTIIIGFAQKDKVLTMTLLKSRDSSNGAVIKYALDLDHGIFRYIPIEGDANNGEGVQELYNEYEYNEEESQPF